jgi:hypothetical protein
MSFIETSTGLQVNYVAWDHNHTLYHWLFDVVDLATGEVIAWAGDIVTLENWDRTASIGGKILGAPRDFRESLLLGAWEARED